MAGMDRTWVDVPSDFCTEVGLTGRNKERAAGSSSTACKSGVSIIALSLSDSCKKYQFNLCKLVSCSIISIIFYYRVQQIHSCTIALFIILVIRSFG